MTIPEQKKALRTQALAARARLNLAVCDVSARLHEHFLKVEPFPKNALVSAYSAIGDEPDPTPLIADLRARGHEIALPRVVRKASPLAFHLWKPGDRLVAGPFGLSEPAREWPQADPDVLIVPLLAFDAKGNRLGYGAAFYDATLSALRARKTILAVGFALSGLEVPEVPHDDSDERLDWIVTECYARAFKG